MGVEDTAELGETSDGASSGRPLSDPGATSSTSPVQVLDERLKVTTPRTWMVLVGVALLLAAGLVWSILGEAPTEVHGQSIMLPPEGLYDVGVGVEGYVQELLVTPGDVVSEGQTLARIRQSNGQVTDVKAAVAGTVVSLLVKRGTFSRAGDPVATLEPKGTDLIGVMYVPAASGKAVHEGMRAYLSPSTAPAAQYGSIIGTVRYVSRLPATSERLRVNLGDNRELIDFLTGGEPVLELAIELEADPSTVSGYRWTSGAGPPFAITSATLGTGSVVVSEKNLASRLFG